MTITVDTTPGGFRVNIPGFDSIFIRPIDIDADAPDLHDWVNRDYARFWGMRGKSLAEVRQRYAEVPSDGKTRHLIAVLASTGEKIGLLVYYWPEADELGPYISATAADRGCHIFLGPGDPKRKRSNLAFYLMVAVQHYAFSDPSVMRLVHQPDLGNEKVLIRLVQAGYEMGKILYLPYKTAQFVYMTRARFQSLDREAPPPKTAYPHWRLKYRVHTFIGRVLRRLGLVRSA